MADPLKERIALLQMGEAQGKLRPEHQEELDSYRAQGTAKGGSSGNGIKAETTANDMAELRESSNRAASERDSMRSYVRTAQAINDFGTGPYKAAAIDAITPSQDGGIMDGIGATLGSVFRPLISDKTMAARDHLNTVNAEVALAGSQQMKGSSSDKDVALMRMGGISAYKSDTENKRVVKAAMVDSGREQTRAKMKSAWISKFGSLSQAAPNGMTFEDGLALAERKYREKANVIMGRKLPAPPPKPRKATTTARPVYDLNGNLIK